MSDINQQLAEIATEIRNDNIEDSSDNTTDDTVSVDSSDNDNSTDTLEEGGIDDETTTDAVGEGAEPEEITTVSGLAEAIGYTPEELYAINIGMGDGEEAISIGAIKDKYQESVRSSKTQKEEIEALKTQVQQANAPGGAASLNSELMQANAEIISIQNQYNGVNWNQVEADDPGQAALLKQKYNEAFGAAQGKASQIQQGIQQGQAQRLQQGAVKLRELIPAWSDSAVMDSGQKEIRSLLHDSGYSDQVINGMDDPVAISLMNELVQLRAEKAAGKKAVGQVRKAPKVLKGATKPSTSNADNLASKAKASGSRNDKVAAVRALLQG